MSPLLSPYDVQIGGESIRILKLKIFSARVVQSTFLYWPKPWREWLLQCSLRLSASAFCLPGAGQRWREAVFSQEPAKRWSGLPIGRTGGHLNQSEVLLPAHYSSDMEPFTPCADASMLHFSFFRIIPLSIMAIKKGWARISFRRWAQYSLKSWRLVKIGRVLETSGGMRVIGRFLCTISSRPPLAELQKIQEGLCNSNPSQDIER